MGRQEPLLTLHEVRFGFPRRPDFLGPLSFSVHAGDCWAIVGPNGAGKSTLLRLMAGFHRPHEGSIQLLGNSLASMPGRARSQAIAFMPQRAAVPPDLTARDLVLMGRFPHRGFGLFESPDDHRFTRSAMETTNTLGFADRCLATLSGGEAQRVHVAAALAQGPRILLLDEPTASLDWKHQLEVFGILRRLADAGETAVIVVTHDVNMAARFCSNALLLDDGKPAAQGSSIDVLTPARLAPVYGVKVLALSDWGLDGGSWLVPADSIPEAAP